MCIEVSLRRLPCIGSSMASPQPGHRKAGPALTTKLLGNRLRIRQLQMMSFLNMTTNSRGMFVIGVAVAAFVLAGFSALYSTGNEKSMGTGKSIEGQIKEQAKEVSLNRDTIRERTRQLDDAEKRRSTAREAENLTTLVQTNRNRIQGLEKQVPALRQAISDLERTLEEEKQRYRTQLLSNPATNAFPELRTLSGKTYRDAHLSSIDGASITFSHQDGSSRVLLKDLPAEIRNRFP